jgi:hypothetical protein
LGEREAHESFQDSQSPSRHSIIGDCITALASSRIDIPLHRLSRPQSYHGRRVLAAPPLIWRPPLLGLARSKSGHVFVGWGILTKVLLVWVFVSLRVGVDRCFYVRVTQWIKDCLFSKVIFVAERCHISDDFASSRPTCFCSAHAEASLALSLAIEFGISKLVKS